MKHSIIMLIMLILTSSTFAQEELEPEFIDYYITYRSGKRVTGSIHSSDKVIIIHIITANAIGNKIVLNIDENIDYFHKKQYFKAGSAFKVPVKRNIEKMRLVIFDRSNKKHVKLKNKALKEK